MFMWAKLFSLLVSLALYILRYMERQKIRSEAQIEIIRQLRDQANEFIRNAETARRNVNIRPDAVLVDPDNRDNDKGAASENGVRELPDNPVLDVERLGGNGEADKGA